MNADTLLLHVTKALTNAAQHDPATEEAPVAILWTDPEGEWRSLVNLLQSALPQFFVLGDYDPAKRQGPALWLKTVLEPGTIPVLYLPGVSRQILRQADQCPWELQPLVELVHRGCVWAQRGGRDWTVAAFVQSADGLNLDLALDARTLASLRASLAVFSQRELGTLRGRRLQAADFDALLVDDTRRDLLAWIAEGDCLRQQWSSERWHAFASRCRAEFNFDPATQAPVAAALMLGQRRTPAWQSLWQRFTEAPALFPGLESVLDRAQPPGATFDEAWPAANRDLEESLRRALTNLENLAPHAARQNVAFLEEEHKKRRNWVWAGLAQAPLAKALEKIAALAKATTLIPDCQHLHEFHQWFVQDGHRADGLVLDVLAMPLSQQNQTAIQSAVRALYAPWLDDCCQHMQALMHEWKPERQGVTAAEGGCLVFVDGMRLDLGLNLAQRLEELGITVNIQTRLAALPTVTATAKAAVAPFAQDCNQAATCDQEFQTTFEGRTLDARIFKTALTRSEYEVLTPSGPLAPKNAASRGWIEAGHCDSKGHDLGAEMPLNLPQEMERLVDLVLALFEAGWTQVTLITDHGWLLLPGALKRHELPLFLVESRWSRCATPKGESQPQVPMVPWHWNPQIAIPVAPGASSFVAAQEYAHGGISPQECIIPVLSASRAGSVAKLHTKIQSITWKRQRVAVEVQGMQAGQRADIQTEDGRSLLSAPKLIETDGQVSLLVPDADLQGTSAKVVILAPDGQILALTPTRIGG